MHRATSYSQPRELRRRHRHEVLPRRRRYGDRQSLVHRRYLDGHVITRQRVLATDFLTQTGRQRRTGHHQYIVRHHRQREPEQRRLRISERVDLASQRLGQFLKGGFDPPASPIQFRRPLRTQPFQRHVGQQSDFGRTIAQRLVQPDDDAAALKHSDADPLLADGAACVATRTGLSPQGMQCRSRVVADQEVGVAGCDSRQVIVGAEVAIAQPQVVSLDQGENRRIEARSLV